MELHHLRYFVAVAEHLNFTRAAAELRLAQPSLTRQIRNLEAELGVSLLDRSSNRVALTREGRTFLGDARHVLELAEESVRTVQRLSRGETGRLGIACSSAFKFELLPASLSAFSRDFPQIGLDLLDLTPAEQLRALESRKIDLGFVGIRPPAIPRGVECECVARFDIVLVLPAKHALAKKKRLSLEQLKQATFVSLSEKTHSGFRDWLCRICRAAGCNPAIANEAESETGLLAYVGAGLGITLAREEIRHLPHPGVVFRQLANPIKGEYCVAWNRDNHSRSLEHYLHIVRSFAAFSPPPELRPVPPQPLPHPPSRLNQPESQL